MKERQKDSDKGESMINGLVDDYVDQYSAAVFHSGHTQL
jgi:hypothetical protein